MKTKEQIEAKIKSLIEYAKLAGEESLNEEDDFMKKSYQEDAHLLRLQAFMLSWVLAD